MTIRKGKCGNRDPHKPHFHDSKTLGHYWCTGVADPDNPDNLDNPDEKETRPCADR